MKQSVILFKAKYENVYWNIGLTSAVWTQDFCYQFVTNAISA
jgi:hypothetical protein